MTRKEMCIFNEIFCGPFNRVMSEEELTKEYGERTLAQAVRRRMNEILWPYMRMAMKGGSRELELDEKTLNAFSCLYHGATNDSKENTNEETLGEKPAEKPEGCASCGGPWPDCTDLCLIAEE